MYETAGGLSGGLRKGCHRLAKHSQSLSQVVTLVPDIDYISPITSTVKMIVTAVQTSVLVREKIADGLADFDRRFEDIVVYSTTFAQDGKVKDASIRILSSILKAVEDIIGYYIALTARKAISSILNGSQYQDALTGSLENIEQDAEVLLNQARNSSMGQVHLILITTQDFAQRLEEQRDMFKSTQRQLDELAQNVCHTQREKVEPEKQCESPTDRLTAQNSVQTPAAKGQCAPPWPSQDLVEHMLGKSTVELADVNYILRQTAFIPEHERARTERVFTTRQVQG
ncbi:hypothetical protein F5Y17DRAFT_415145 [Xylariaceae sp. FL0594]|nr:hypothetical protein F5Y17DRAFT_415145 [Xylariaceae sp. FL0594]